MTTDNTPTIDATPADDAELSDDQLEATAGGVWGGPNGDEGCTPTISVKIGAAGQ